MSEFERIERMATFIARLEMMLTDVYDDDCGLSVWNEPRYADITESRLGLLMETV